MVIKFIQADNLDRVMMKFVQLHWILQRVVLKNLQADSEAYPGT